MILAIPFIWLGIVLIHGLCRSFYEVGLEKGRNDAEINILMVKEGFGFRFMPDPMHRERSQKIIDDMLAKIPKKEDSDVWRQHLNPFLNPYRL